MWLWRLAYRRTRGHDVAWYGMLLNHRRTGQLFWIITTFPWPCLTNDGKLLSSRPRPLPHLSLSAFILPFNKVKRMHLIHRHVTDKAAEWISVQLRHSMYDAEWPTIHLQILQQILRLFISLSRNFKWPSWTLTAICPRTVRIYQYKNVVTSNTNIGLCTRQQCVTFLARTLIRWIIYVIMQHSVISKTDYRRWFHLHLTFVQINGVPLLLQTNKQTVRPFWNSGKILYSKSKFCI
jgi:hypothetical protein